MFERDFSSAPGESAPASGARASGVAETTRPAVVPLRPRAPDPISPRQLSPREVPETDLLVFALRGMRFALPAARIVDTLPVTGERWGKLLNMAAAGTLGSSGLPLIRLSARLGFPPETAPERGALVLFGTGGRVRATVLVDDAPVRMRARVAPMPAAWRAHFQPCAELIEGVALLPDGTQAAMLDLAIGVDAPRARVMPRAGRDSAHLLVRAGRRELEAVRVAALRGLQRIDDGGAAGGRALLLLGGEGEAVAVDEVIGLAPQGRVERIAGVRYLVASNGRYRLLEPGETSPDTLAVLRVLVTAPPGAARDTLRDLVRAMGHDVSLADDPRAARLAGGRFDVVLFDLDTYADVREAGIAVSDGARRIGLSAQRGMPVPAGFERVVTAGDAVALIAALIGSGA
ncbi:chemotaxis protein CheW [Ancylobacter sp. G4_0304]|uniref:chemotaxis protein CheW n=1 Tax=Ancylobacter sp. G4_0304 TaxID=3114289 RepID=UPI0039C6486A